MKTTYTADLTLTYSGTLTFENVPENIYHAIIRLLDGKGVLEPLPPADNPSRDPEEEMMSISETIAALTIFSGATFDGIAASIGAQPDTVRCWVNGYKTPGETRLKDLANYFGVDRIPMTRKELDRWKGAHNG